MIEEDGSGMRMQGWPRGLTNRATGDGEVAMQWICAKVS